MSRAQPALTFCCGSPGPAALTCSEIAKQTPDIGPHCFLRREFCLLFHALSGAMGDSQRVHGNTEQEMAQTLTRWAVSVPHFIRRGERKYVFN